jgi:hypothetical protein
MPQPIDNHCAVLQPGDSIRIVVVSSPQIFIKASKQAWSGGRVGERHQID